MVFIKSFFVAMATWLVIVFAVGVHPLIATAVAAFIQYKVSQELEGMEHVTQ